MRRRRSTTAIRLVAGPVERRLHREQYQALIHGLEESGITVFEEPSTEARSFPGGVESVAIAIYLVDRLGGALLDELLLEIRDAVVRALRGAGPAGRVRVVRIFGSDSSRLKDIEVPPDERQGH